MDVDRVVRIQITSGELDPSSELIDSLNNSSVQLLSVVKALGEYLTATEDDVRLKGLTFLSRVITRIDDGKINRPAGQTLTNFFLSKLDDFDSIIPALEALLVLSKQRTFDDEAAVQVYQQIVENVNMKAYAQATRHQVYRLLDSLLASHRSAFKAMGQDFINSYTKLVDGEKDPRNLMLLFQLDRVILLEFDVEKQIEELFDITFCYFPITFRPPPNDPYGITADDLKGALRECMSASPYFAKMALPLFLEKFVTASGPTMKDLLLTMAACFPVYGSAAVGERGQEFWEAIRTEVNYSTEETAALSALESLVRTIYPNESDTPSGLAQTIIKQCQEGLREPDKNGAGAAKSIAAMVRASASAGRFAIAQVLPQLFQQFNNPTLPSHRLPILNALTTILLAAQSVYGPSGTRRETEERSLEPFREPLFDILREGMRTDGLEVTAVRGSVALAEIPGFWSKLEVEEIVGFMNNLLVTSKDNEVRSAVLVGLKAVAATQPDIVQSTTLPLLFHTLPDEAPAEDGYEAREKYRSILDSLKTLCVLPALFETLTVRITTKLDLLSSSPSASTETVSRDCSVSYAWDLLRALQDVIDTKLESKHVDVARHFSQITPRLSQLVVEAVLPRVGGAEPLFRDRRLIALVASISETLFAEQTAEKQAKPLEDAHQAFDGGRLGAIVYNPANIKTAGESSPLRANASTSEQDLVALYSALIRGLKSDTVLPFSSPTDFLTSVVHWAVQVCRDEFALQAALSLICAFVNKRIVDVKEALEPLLETLWVKDIQDTTQPFDTRRRALLVYLHIVKALALLRNDLAYSAVDRIVDVLGLYKLDPVFVEEAARAFAVLADEGKAKSKTRTHLTKKLLFAQKLWNHLLPKLVTGDKEAETTQERTPYLVAFASLLPLVPAPLLLADLTTILPVLLRSLYLPNPVQRINVITTLTAILESASSSTASDSLLHEHAESVVDGFLHSALREAGVETSGAVRAAALTALAAVPDAIRYETLHTSKARVLRQLGRGLDDPLRLVRREAVDTRARWYRYGK